MHTDVSPDAPELIAAAKWWREALRNPRFDNGGTSQHDTMVSMMASMGRTPPSAEQLDKFETALREAMAFFYNQNKFWESGCNFCRALRVDYNADQLLESAYGKAFGQQSTINTFPWKTRMFVSPGKVEVGCGYGAEPVIIYPQE